MDIFICIFSLLRNSNERPIIKTSNMHMRKFWKKMLPDGLEPLTLRLLAVRSNQLS